MQGSSQPLAGCVIISTADRRKREIGAALERRGAHVVQAPALSTIPHLDDHTLIAATRALIAEPPDVVVVTTGIGFRGWIDAADAAGLAEPLLAVLGHARLIARGPKARGAMQSAGLDTEWVATSETAVEVRDHLLAQGLAGLRIAVQHHGNGSDGLDEAFAAAGADVVSLLVYGWGAPADPQHHRDWVLAAAAGHADAVAFTSAPAAEAWWATARESGVAGDLARRSVEGSLLLAAVGPVTARPLVDAGLTVHHPQRWRLGALVRLLVQFFSNGEEFATPEGALVMRATTAVLAGRVLSLTPATQQVLRTLVDARGGVVSRGELAARLPGPQAGSHAVEAAINRLRDQSGAPGLVRTVVKRGYALSVGAA
jgi:uroporphyrinogen-III synthase